MLVLCACTVAHQVLHRSKTHTTPAFPTITPSRPASMGKRYTVWVLQCFGFIASRTGNAVTLTMSTWNAGMYKAMTVRSNPRLRTVNSVLRTYITVLHVKLQQKEAMFASAASKAHGARAASEVPATPGTPGSMAGSEVGSQVLLPSCFLAVSTMPSFAAVSRYLSVFPSAGEHQYLSW